MFLFFEGRVSIKNYVKFFCVVDLSVLLHLFVQSILYLITMDVYWCFPLSYNLIFLGFLTPVVPALTLFLLPLLIGSCIPWHTLIIVDFVCFFCLFVLAPPFWHCKVLLAHLVYFLSSVSWNLYHREITLVIRPVTGALGEKILKHSVEIHWIMVFKGYVTQEGMRVSGRWNSDDTNILKLHKRDRGTA